MSAPSEKVDGSPITISVKTLDARVLKVQIDRNKTVLELKEVLSSQCNLAAGAQRLIFKGKVLKDDQTLASYAIDEGFVLHLVERPPGAPTPAAGPTSQQAPAAGRPQAQPARPSAPPQGGFAPTVLIGSINLPSGTLPDMTHMVNAASAADGAAGGAPAAAAPVADPLDPLRQSLDQLQAAIGRVPATPAPSSANAAGTPAAQLAGLATQLRALEGHIQQLNPHITRAAAVLSQEASLTTQQQRQEAEQLVTSLGAALGALGQSASTAGAVAAQTRFGDAVGKSTILPVARPRSTSASISVSVPLFTMRRADGGPAPAGGGANAPGGAAPGMQVNAGAGAVQNAGPAAQASMQGLAPLFQMMGSLLRGGVPGAPAGAGVAGGDAAHGGAGPAAGAGGASAGGAPDGLAGLMQMMGPALQQLSQMSAQAHPGGAPAQQRPAAAQPQAAGASPATAPRAAPAAAGAAAPAAAAVPAAAAPASSAQASRAPAAGSGSQTAVMMSHMYTQLLQDIPRLTAPGAPPMTVQAFLTSMANTPDTAPDPNDVLSQLVHVLLENLTLTELLEISAGNWTAMERLHPVMRDQLLRSAAGHGTPAAAAAPSAQPSPAQFARLADNMVASMKEAVAEEHLPPNLKALVLPGRELTQGSLAVLRTRSEALLRLIAQAPGSHTVGFAEGLRQWSVSMVQEIVNYLAASLRNGVHDVPDVLRFFIAERMSGLGEIAQFGSQLVTSYVMNTYAATLPPAAPSTAPPSPMAGPPPPLDPDPNTWAPIITQDEIAQMNMPPQPPHSEAYRASAPGAKKRKSRAAATPDAQLADRVRGAAKRAAKAKKKDGAATNEDDSGEETLSEVIANAATESPVLVELYRQLLDRALKDREASKP